jgi:hypothetical protein
MERGVKIVKFTMMALDLRLFKLHAALIMLPCMGSLKHVTMCPMFHIANTKARNFSIGFFAPMHTIIINFLNLLFGFKISQNFTRLLVTSCHSLVANIPLETYGYLVNLLTF